MLKVREETQDELDQMRMTSCQPDAAIVNVREETSAQMTKVRLELDSGAARHRQLLASICHFLEAREKCKHKMPNTLAKSYIFYDDGCKVRV